MHLQGRVKPALELHAALNGLVPELGDDVSKSNSMATHIGNVSRGALIICGIQPLKLCKVEYFVRGLPRFRPNPEHFTVCRQFLRGPLNEWQPSQETSMINVKDFVANVTYFASGVSGAVPLISAIFQ
eukprot:9313645-Karenia_brevis.AAC.1